MKVIDFRTSTSLVEAVRQVKAESYKSNERIVAEFNNFILDSNKSEEDNQKEYYAQWNKQYDNNGIDWEQRRYEIANEILPSVYKVEFVNSDYKEMVKIAINLANELVKQLKEGNL